MTSTDPTTADPVPLIALMRRLRGGERTWTAAAAVRFDTWLDTVEADDALRSQLREGLGVIIASTRQVGFFADLGVAPPHGFGAELAERLLHKVLPADHDPGELKDWMRLLFGRPRAASWAVSIPADRWARLARVLRLHDPDEPARVQFGSELLESMKILSARIAAIGVDPRVARVHPDAQRSASPFLEQQAAVRAHVDAWLAVWARRDAHPSEDDRPIRVLLDQCREVLRRIHRNTGRTGVTVDLTVQLQRLAEIIDRLELLLDLFDHTAAPSDRHAAWHRLVCAQVRACGEETSLRAFWRRSTQLAALEVTEHAGRTGDHYIVSSRDAWWAMLRSAAIGGAVIGLMAIAKILIARMHAPPLVEGVLVSLNYGLGFVLIHLLHGTVATKQPAMTAARIAAEIGDAQAGGGPTSWLPRVTELLVQVVRSQLVAVAGNVGVALPVAVAVTLTALWLTGAAPASPQKAATLLGQLDPLGLTLLYAAIAGVCLFLAGVVSGYCDNLAVFHRLPRRVASMPLLVRWAGRERAAAVGAYVEHNFGALAGNFLFGCMLGGTTLLGTLTGLPLDIRHVAFASANLGVAGTVLWPQLTLGALLVGALGVALIAAVNLAVSFTLSLMLALRARRLTGAGVGAMWRAFAARLIAHPLDVLRPPPAASGRGAPGAD